MILKAVRFLSVVAVTIGLPSHTQTGISGGVHEVVVSMPTHITVQRSVSRLKVFYDLGSLQDISVKVDDGLVLGMDERWFVYPKGESRPGPPFSRGLTSVNENDPARLSHLTSSFTLERSQGGIPAVDKTYVIEVEISLFESDRRTQHHWNPTSSTQNKVLWHGIVLESSDSWHEPTEPVQTVFAQKGHIDHCYPARGFDLGLVSNLDGHVTFKCDQATAMDLVQAVGFQSRIPIGIVLGRDLDALSKTSHSYNIENSDAQLALAKALEGTGYAIKQEMGVTLLVAGDLAPRQRELLLHQYWRVGTGWTRNNMVCFGVALAEMLRNVSRPNSYFAGSCTTSTKEEIFDLQIAPGATTEQIANQIVDHGSKGMWVFKASALPSAAQPQDTLEVTPYQHYSNRAVNQH